MSFAHIFRTRARRGAKDCLFCSPFQNSRPPLLGEAAARIASPLPKIGRHMGPRTTKRACRLGVSVCLMGVEPSPKDDGAAEDYLFWDSEKSFACAIAQFSHERTFSRDQERVLNPKGKKHEDRYYWSG